MRAFVKLREIMSTHKDLVRKINAMEKKYDYQIKSLFDAIHEGDQRFRNFDGAVGLLIIFQNRHHRAAHC